MEIYEDMALILSEDSSFKATVKTWASELKRGTYSIEDNPRLGCLKTSSPNEQLWDLEMTDFQKIATSICISSGSAQAI